jgi:hypothetical protein
MAFMNGYSSHDLERFVSEPAKRAGRTEFMRDRARVIHSASLRRLGANPSGSSLGERFPTYPIVALP